MTADQQFNKRKAPRFEEVTARASVDHCKPGEDEEAIGLNFSADDGDYLENRLSSKLRVHMTRSEAISLGRQLLELGEMEVRVEQ